MLQARFVVIREAAEVLLRHLKHLPPSDRREQACWAGVHARNRDVDGFFAHDG